MGGRTKNRSFYQNDPTAYTGQTTYPHCHIPSRSPLRPLRLLGLPKPWRRRPRFTPSSIPHSQDLRPATPSPSVPHPCCARSLANEARRTPRRIGHNSTLQPQISTARASRWALCPSAPRCSTPSRSQMHPPDRKSKPPSAPRRKWMRTRTKPSSSSSATASNSNSPRPEPSSASPPGSNQFQTQKSHRLRRRRPTVPPLKSNLQYLYTPRSPPRPLRLRVSLLFSSTNPL